MSVYLTMVFSNKTMKGLLIVLCVSESPQIVRKQALLNTERRQRAHLSMLHDTTPLTHREKRKTNRLIFYIAVFLCFNNHRH